MAELPRSSVEFRDQLLGILNGGSAKDVRHAPKKLVSREAEAAELRERSNALCLAGSIDVPANRAIGEPEHLWQLFPAAPSAGLREALEPPNCGSRGEEGIGVVHGDRLLMSRDIQCHSRSHGYRAVISLIFSEQTPKSSASYRSRGCTRRFRSESLPFLLALFREGVWR